jgi:hypothetical protein
MRQMRRLCASVLIGYRREFVLESADSYVSESVLTGESFPVAPHMLGGRPLIDTLLFSAWSAWLADLQHPLICGGQSIEGFAKAALSRPHPPAVSGAFVTPEILDSSTGNEVRRAGDHRIAVS